MSKRHIIGADIGSQDGFSVIICVAVDEKGDTEIVQTHTIKYPDGKTLKEKEKDFRKKIESMALRHNAVMPDWITKAEKRMKDFCKGKSLLQLIKEGKLSIEDRD
nr:hypothetical protein [uncultured Draconibacterium sp.]